MANCCVGGLWQIAVSRLWQIAVLVGYGKLLCWWVMANCCVGGLRQIAVLVGYGKLLFHEHFEIKCH